MEIDVTEKTFFNPGDLVIVKHDIDNKPVMFVVEKATRSLYNKVMLAIAEVKGISFRQQTRDNKNGLESVEVLRNGVQSLMLDNPGNLNNDTLNNLTRLVSEAYQNVREDMQRELGTIRELVDNLKKDKNFGKILEMTSGNAANLFKNMIEHKDGDILFKNPWDPKFAGSTAERKFLEYALAPKLLPPK